MASAMIKYNLHLHMDGIFLFKVSLSKPCIKTAHEICWFLLYQSTKVSSGRHGPTGGEHGKRASENYKNNRRKKASYEQFGPFTAVGSEVAG